MSQFKDCLPGICIPTIFALWWKVITSFSFNSVQGYLGILAAADTGTVFQILQAINCKVQLPQSRNWADRNIYKNRNSPWGGKKPAIWSLQLFCLQNCHVWQKWWSKLQIFLVQCWKSSQIFHLSISVLPACHLYICTFPLHIQPTPATPTYHERTILNFHFWFLTSDNWRSGWLMAAWAQAFCHLQQRRPGSELLMANIIM